MPTELPRVEHRHEPESCKCVAYGHGLVKIGEYVSEQLDVESARFFLHRHIRPQYACRSCEAVIERRVPAAIIDGGMAAPGLLEWRKANTQITCRIKPAVPTRMRALSCRAGKAN